MNLEPDQPPAPPPRPRKDDAIHEASWGYILSRLDEAVDRVDRSPEELRNAVSLGVQDALRAVMKDNELRAAFWKSGFEHLSSHASSASTQWVGKRILTALILACLAFGIGWLSKNGKL